LTKKYVIFKDDDVGKDTIRLKKWVDVVIKNDAKAAVGLIGKYMKDQSLIKYLNSLDHEKIEIFCHGYYHKHYPYIFNKITGSKELPKTEYNKDVRKHNYSLKQYRTVESKYLKTKAVTFGPQGNIWNENVIDPLLKNDFKMMFSWEKIGGGLLRVPLTSNLRDTCLNDFIEGYKNNKNDVIYTLQFHHAKLSEKNFEVMGEVIDFLKNQEGRIFVTPSELFEISKKDEGIYTIMTS